MIALKPFRQKYEQIQLRLDPVKRSHIKPDTYWNDWFGRPGAGAPNRSYYKQDLDDMLEPKFNQKFFLNKPILYSLFMAITSSIDKFLHSSQHKSVIPVPVTVTVAAAWRCRRRVRPPRRHAGCSRAMTRRRQSPRFRAFSRPHIRKSPRRNPPRVRQPCIAPRSRA